MTIEFPQIILHQKSLKDVFVNFTPKTTIDIQNHKYKLAVSALFNLSNIKTVVFFLWPSPYFETRDTWRLIYLIDANQLLEPISKIKNGVDIKKPIILTDICHRAEKYNSTSFSSLIKIMNFNIVLVL